MMRLLHASRWEMRETISDDEIPPYAILSHTWGQGEISFQDWTAMSPQVMAECRLGFRKIEFSRRQAVEDGIDWVWVDT